MKHLKPGIAVLAAALVAVPAAAQTVYRWVDKDGRVQFSDTPPNDDTKVTQQRAGGGGDEAPLPYGLQMAMKNHPVTLFVGNSCGDFCVSGRALLNKRGIPYRERNAEVNKADAEALAQVAGSLTVPTLQVGQQTLTGFTEDSWNAALDAGGYPRTRLPGLKLPSPTPPPAAARPAAPPAPPTPEAKAAQ